jgi:hypothetical protein
MDNNLRRGLIFAAICFGVFLLYWSFGHHEEGGGFKGVAASQLWKSRRVTQMLSDLLASVEAEKNAILAGSDEDSGEFAAKAKAFSEKVEQSRQELLSNHKNEFSGPETKLLDEFTVAWGEFLTIDKELLGQAVLNTNLKAYRISASQAVQSFTDFEQAIRQTVQSSGQSDKIGQLAAHGLIALGMTAKILAMQAPHIAEASDSRMDEMEREMAVCAKAAQDSLDAMQLMITEQGRETFLDALRAFHEFNATNTEVVRLSRINSNVKALALSMGQKRRVTARCEELLETLRETIDTRLSKATR